MFIKDSEIKLENPAPGITRKVMSHSDDMMLVKVFFAADAEALAPHKHPHNQVSYIVKGKFKVVVGDEEKILSEGDCFYAQPNIPHGVTVLDGDGVLVDVFTPIREDFLT